MTHSVLNVLARLARRLSFLILPLMMKPCLLDAADNDRLFRAVQYQIPVLVGKDRNEVLQLEIPGNNDRARTLTEVQLSMAGTGDLAGIKSIKLLYPDPANAGDYQMFGEKEPSSETVTFSGHLSFKGDLSLRVAVVLRDDIDLTSIVNIAPLSAIIDGRKWIVEDGFSPKNLRTGVALRRHGQDGVHTYRIPGLTTTRNGTLLAVYDVRRESSRDLQGDMDIGLSRSVDGGRTWEPMRIIMDMGEWGGLPAKFNGVSDANVLYDEKNHTVIVSALWMHGVLDVHGKWIEGLTEESTAWEHQWRRRGSQPGFGVKETSQFLLTKSTDDGKTWSDPVNITAATKPEEWWLWAPAPGRGITLSDGTLVIPTQGRDRNGIPFSNITWSRDGGETWTTSAPAYTRTTESNAVELSDGSIMLNMRHNANRGNLEINGRAVAVTADLGETWSEHPTSRRALIEPTCMASLHVHHFYENGSPRRILVFANPNSKIRRDQMTVKVSFDDGMTWPESHWLLLDELSGRGYSSITSIDEETIGIVYEGSQADLIFQKIKISELLD